MEQLAVHFPTLTRPLIGERDEYMAFRLRMLASKCGLTPAQARNACRTALLAVRWGACACASCTQAHSSRACVHAFRQTSIVVLVPRYVARVSVQICLHDFDPMVLRQGIARGGRRGCRPRTRYEPRHSTCYQQRTAQHEGLCCLLIQPASSPACSSLPCQAPVRKWCGAPSLRSLIIHSMSAPYIDTLLCHRMSSVPPGLVPQCCAERGMTTAQEWVCDRAGLQAVWEKDIDFAAISELPAPQSPSAWPLSRMAMLTTCTAILSVTCIVCLRRLR